MTRGRKAEHLVDQVFTRLTVIERDTTKKSRVFWWCICECNVLKSVAACELKAGKTKSCGCMDAERKKVGSLKHGYNRTPTYVCWSNMIARCGNKNRPDYKNYGGRGISVCKRWRDFSNFLQDMGEKPPNLSIERNDNNGNYELSNCRWATSSEQRRNQRPRAAAAIGEAMP